jgi:2-polyprenyl-3-methyl-5-hydroxy-6-metoxy-1,4-benzoquinol methylase
MNAFDMEVRKGERFEFGKNWQSFLLTLTDEKIAIAEDSIKDMLGIDDLNNKYFLDIGSGSGVFSLAARNLGARVHSFDYDPASVACARELRLRYFPNDPSWTIEEGSILDKKFLKSLGSFEIVYSWGVLHHTGDMWTAIENAASLVKDNGMLCIALYNDQGRRSRLWKMVKRMYCSGVLGKALISCVFIPVFLLRTLRVCAVKRENIFAGYKKQRGMSITHDWFDWLGGLPFEVATVERVFHFLRERGFRLSNVKTTISFGNNQFVFARKQDQAVAVHRQSVKQKVNITGSMKNRLQQV